MKNEPKTIEEIAVEMGVDLGPEMNPRRGPTVYELSDAGIETNPGKAIDDQLVADMAEVKIRNDQHRARSTHSSSHALAVMQAMAAANPYAGVLEKILDESHYARSRPTRTETDVSGFHPDRPKPKKLNNRPKKLRKKR